MKELLKLRRNDRGRYEVRIESGQRPVPRGQYGFCERVAVVLWRDRPAAKIEATGHPRGRHRFAELAYKVLCVVLFLLKKELPCRG